MSEVETMAAEEEIKAVCDELCAMLQAKNRAYGDSALSPLRVFSKASAEEQLLVRIDDKLSRLARGAAAGEDVERDLAGYLVLLLVLRRRQAVEVKQSDNIEDYGQRAWAEGIIGRKLGGTTPEGGWFIEKPRCGICQHWGVCDTGEGVKYTGVWTNGVCSLTGEQAKYTGACDRFEVKP